MIRVLIVAPSSRARRELEHTVTQDPGLVLLAASDSFEALDRAIDERRPDFIVLDPGPEPHMPITTLLEQPFTRDTTPFVVTRCDLHAESELLVSRDVLCVD